ncbi:MAG: inositol monophosphatase family protein [Blastomonas sp.]
MTFHPLHEPVSALLRHVGETVLMRHFRNLSPDQVQMKGVDDPVTIADQESEALLAERLAEILPGTLIVGEESVAADPSVMDRLHGAQCWIIDPIDGTANFAAGKQPFGILLALAEAGEVVAGWIFDPVSGRLCHAYAGHGAWIDDMPVIARESGRLPPVAAISTMFVDPADRDALIKTASSHYQLVDIPRCAAEQYPRLALGINDITLFERTLPWDHAAGILFINEAGGKAARRDGSPYRITDGRKGLIAAASPRLWEEAASIFA